MIAALWAWCRAHPVLAFVVAPLLIVLAILALLYRGARASRNAFRARAESAEGSVRRTEELRTTEQHARDTAAAAHADLDARQHELEERTDELARDTAARLDAIAAAGDDVNELARLARRAPEPRGGATPHNQGGVR